MSTDDEILARVLQQSLEEAQEEAARRPDAAFMDTMFSRGGLMQAAQGAAPGERRYVDHLNRPRENQETVQYRRVTALDMARKETPGHWLQYSMCPISQQEFEPTAVVAVTSCGHAMLRSGLESWVQTRSTCPVCRKRLFNPWLSPSVEVWTHGNIDATVDAAIREAGHEDASAFKLGSGSGRSDVHIHSSAKAKKRRGSRWAVPKRHPLLEGVPEGHRVIPPASEYAYRMRKPQSVVD